MLETIMSKEQRTSIYTDPNSETGNLLRSAAEVMEINTHERGWVIKVIKRAVTFYLVHHAKKGQDE